VNRIFSNKPGGLVVDFIGISDQLKEATKKYTLGGGAGNPAPNISEEAKGVFVDTLAAVRDLLPELPDDKNYGGWRALANIEFEDLFLQCCGHLTETDELRDDFLAAEATLNSAFSLVNHLAECIGYADEVVFYQLLRKQLLKTTSGPSPKDEQKAKPDWFIRACSTTPPHDLESELVPQNCGFLAALGSYIGLFGDDFAGCQSSANRQLQPRMEIPAWRRRWRGSGRI
jgi:type I site-specific restriction-modification system R (restriction) subunit